MAQEMCHKLRQWTDSYAESYDQEYMIDETIAKRSATGLTVESSAQ